MKQIVSFSLFILMGFNMVIAPSKAVTLSGSEYFHNKSSLPFKSNVNSSQTVIESSSTEMYNNKNRHNLILPGETDIKNLLPTSGELLPPPFGANLFAGGYETERINGLNDNYTIAIGDKINVWLWGAVNYSNVVTVDNQGNIFIPEVGPIRVQGVRSSDVNQYVVSKIRKVYTQNVNVYVNLLSVTPVSIYLAGHVIRPGQYAGMASDSVLYYLKRAGGIDPERGSYREIIILRKKRKIYSIDLYDFIHTGNMPTVDFKDGDTILVKPQKSTIAVSGKVRNPFRFELDEQRARGTTLISYSRPLAKVSHVGVSGHRASGPFSLYMQYKEFLNFELKDGDKVVFNDDLHAQVIDVQVTGSYLGPSYFSVSKRTRLHELLSYIPIDPKLANTQSIYILRPSVAQQQKEMIEESLNRLERSVFTAPASSDGEAEIRAKEAEMVMQFSDRARQIEPLGKVIVSEDGNIANILLEQGDKIVIPRRTDLIQIGGEVLMPQAVVYNSNASLDDYVAWAGGFTERAEDRRIAIVRANGLVEFDSKGPIEKGDQILVLPRVDTKTMQTVKDITQIIYQIAVAANVALN